MFGWIKDGFVNTHYKVNPILSKFPLVRFNPENISEYGFKFNKDRVPERIADNFSYRAYKLSKPLSHLIFMMNLSTPEICFYFFFDSNGLLVEFWAGGHILNMSGKKLEHSEVIKWLTDYELAQVIALSGSI